MKKIGDKYTNNIFENIKHIDEHESEYWYARELSKVLEYRDWRNFLKVLNKAQDYKLSRRKGAFKNKIFLKDVEED